MRIVASILLLFLITACSSSRSGKSVDLSGDWEMISLSNSSKPFAEMFAERRPSLTFDGGKSTVTGTTGCNRLSGSFKRKGNMLKFGENIITTRMACEGYEENSFLNALAQVNAYQVTLGQLRLMRDTTLVMAFRRP